MRRLLALAFLVASSLEAASLTLINDSAFPLYANIYNAAGIKEITIKMSSGQTYIWGQDQSPFKKQYDTPTTPYTVRWTCTDMQPYDYSVGKKKPQQKYSIEYGVWNNVPLGATINAQGSTSGTMTCTVRKEDATKSSSKVAQQKQRKYKNEGFNNWSNDGGQTWSNDAGPGWEEEDEMRRGDPGWTEATPQPPTSPKKQ
jgi:hypothetical protein